jgi:hypothetical protein
MNPKKRIGEMLLDAGIIDEAQLKAALGHQRQWGVRLGQALVDLKLATERDIVRTLSLKFGLEVANLAVLDPYGHAQAVKLFPREFAVGHNVFPMWADTANVTVAMSDPTNLAVVDEIRFRTGRRVKVCIGGDHEIAAAVAGLYPGGGPMEAIALDLDADPATVADSVFDPFGDGANDPGEPLLAPAKAPAAAPRAAARPPADLELEEHPAVAAYAAKPGSGSEAVELADLQLPGDPVLASDLAPHGEAGEGASRELSPRELAILESLERLAHGAPAEPEVVKPAHAMAAMLRLLIRKRIVTEQEFLEELSKK